MEAAARRKKRPRTADSQIGRPSRRDDSKLHSCSALPPPNMDCLPDPHNNNWRDWAGLHDGPAGLIAKRVLAYDVADYVRFRAVCRLWRHCCTEQRRSHNVLDRRFHPRRWTMLREELAAPNRRCFLNTFTGECIQVHIPELHDHELLGLTNEGLVVLAHKPTCATILCLLNPLTRHLVHLPSLSQLLPLEYHEDMPPERADLCLNSNFVAWGSGIANDGSMVVLCLSRLGTIAMAKPGDDHWTLIHYNGSGICAPIMFEGRFYCIVNHNVVMVLEMESTRLEVAANLNMRFAQVAGRLHLVNNCGEMMLVHSPLRWHRRLGARKEVVRCYDVYHVDLNTWTLFPVKSLGGRAMFMGKHCSLPVSLNVFPSGSISADTIYLSPSVDPNARAYHLTDGSREDTSWRDKDSWVPRPHTLADCLSLSVTP